MATQLGHGMFEVAFELLSTTILQEILSVLFVRMKINLVKSSNAISKRFWIQCVVTWFESNPNGRPACWPSRPLNNLKVKSLELRYWFGIPMPLAVWSISPPKNTKILNDYDYNKIKDFRSLKKFGSSILTHGTWPLTSGLYCHFKRSHLVFCSFEFGCGACLRGQSNFLYDSTTKQK